MVYIEGKQLDLLQRYLYVCTDDFLEIIRNNNEITEPLYDDFIGGIRLSGYPVECELELKRREFVAAENGMPAKEYSAVYKDETIQKVLEENTWIRMREGDYLSVRVFVSSRFHTLLGLEVRNKKALLVENGMGI